MKNIVVIGGGHGQATIIRGIKKIKGAHIFAIVTVADDGGSTGRLREIYNIPAVGDIRNVLLAMSDEEKEYARLLDYRFEGNGKGDVIGHSLGNLVLAAAMGLNGGSLNQAIKDVGRFLRAKGRVIPSSLETITLYAKYEDGTIGTGEANIPNRGKRIEDVFYDHDVKADVDALNAIMDADLIVFGIGSLYTSIMPITIISEIEEAMKKSKAKKIYIANCMTQKGETLDYDLKDHVDALTRHGAEIDLVVKHNDTIPKDILERYKAEGGKEVVYNNNLDIPVIERELLDFSNNNCRHDPKKIKEVIEELLED